MTNKRQFMTTVTAPQPSDGRYVNRELSLLAFNERVLFMAERPDVPLLERLRYLCIVSSNLDEIFEIRVSGMKAKIRQGSGDLLEADGYSPYGNQLAVSERAQELIDHQYRLLNESIMPALATEGIRLHLAVTFNEAQRKWAHQYFMKEVLPVLTPIGLDPSHPFPRTLNKSLNFMVELKGKDAFGRRGTVAVVQAPRILPRLIPVPPEVSGYPHGFMMLTSVVQDNVQELFPGMTVLGVHQFRVTRNSDLFVDDEEITDLRETLRGELSQRQFGDAVRIEVSEATPDHLLDLLKREYRLETMDCYRVNGPVNLVRLMSLPDLVNRPDLKFPTFMASYPSRLSRENPFVEIAKGDVLMHHPYESFNAVIDFLQAAARDPAVVAINMTVYRTGQTSELMDSLILAAKSGKAVTVVVELMARFDEETNINWASKLEQVGAHVVFGVVGNKTHAKACLVVRREKTGLRRYAHLGTGNYHPGKAKLYEDFGLFTADPQICADVHEIFHQLTGLGQNKPTRKVWHSPFTLHANVMKAISQEMRLAKQGKRAHIMAKMNSLVELEVIEKLYAASQAGVKVDLIIRGICMLRPGIPGLSDNIQVRSTIGRFLEHSRIFYFRHDGDEQVYLSSADWMDRNFFRRVELAVPVLNPILKKRVIREGLRMHLTDTDSSWVMQPNGSYRLRRTGQGRSVQHELLDQLAGSGA
jgi:polyphosphate kinase